MRRTREEVLSAIQKALSQSQTNIFVDAVALYLAKEYIEQQKSPRRQPRAKRGRRPTNHTVKRSYHKNNEIFLNSGVK